MPEIKLDKINFLSLGLTEKEAVEILNNLITGKVTMLALSGKMGSGKDTLAEKAMSLLKKEKVIHVYFGNEIKNEVDKIIHLLPSFNNLTSSILSESIQIEFELPNLSVLNEISELIIIEYENSKLSGTPLTARNRSDNMRRILQLWGTEVRRSLDENYWVNKTIIKALKYASSGFSVYLTDARFPNEAILAQKVGFIVGRIDISEETRRKRLASRDNIQVDSITANHPTEISLDDYENFNFRVDNNDETEKSVEEIINFINGVRFV